MSYQSVKTPAVAEQALAEPYSRDATQTAMSQCLIVSADPHRRQRLWDSAIDGGWNAIVCADAETAIKHAERQIVQLALVDLQRPDGGPTPGCRRLVERLSSDPRVLVAVCGSQDDPADEIWARQLGTWLYLPGMSEQEDLAMVCTEARKIADRWTRPEIVVSRRSPARTK